MDKHTPEDEEYFNKLYYEMYRVLYQYAARMCTERSDIEDVLQETFKEAHIHIQEVRNSPNSKGYMMNVLKHKLMKLRDKKMRELEEPQRIAEDSMVEEEPEEKIMVWDFCQKTLNDIEYKIIIRRYRDRASIAEISRELGITEGACKMRMKRSLIKLKKAYEKELKRK